MNEEQAPTKEHHTLCLHCGLPIPAGLQRKGIAFCCRGCETVHHLLQSCGLTDIHAQAWEGMQAPVQPASNYATFDDETFLELYAPPQGDDYRSIELYLSEVHCAACVWLLERLPTMVTGVIEARVHFPKRKLSITWNPSQVPLSEVATILERLGYVPQPYRGLSREREHEKELNHLLIRIGVAGACAGNVMLIAFALYGAFFEGMEHSVRQFFRWTSLILTVPAVFWAGRSFFQGAWAALRMRTLHMDLPIALGLGAGFLSGAFHTISGTGEIYFDTVTSLIFLLLIGRWLRLKQQHRAYQATELLYSLTPASAHRVDGEQCLDVPVETLKAGDLIEVRAGERVPADGVVLEGRSQVDASILTGESLPQPVSKGRSVFTGTINVSARLLVRVEESGVDTRVAQIMALVEQASQQRAPITRLVDRWASSFVMAVLLLAGLTLCLWWWIDPSHALTHTMALLIISCPCALSLATPLAISASIGRAAQHGLLIKGGEALEALAQPGELWLDKTGTLTTGQLSLLHFYGDRRWLPWVQALESHSAHPIAQAIGRGYCGDSNEEASACTSEHALFPLSAQVNTSKDALALLEGVTQHLGLGIEAFIGGRPLRVGSPAFITHHLGEKHARTLSMSSASLSPSTLISELVSHACTPIVVAFDSEIVAVLGLGDQIRGDAPAILSHLRDIGWKLGILSGDHPAVVKVIAERLRLPAERCHGGVGPEEKQEWIEARQALGVGTIVMVGDGVNDTAALATADVGISVHGGAEASLAVADVFLSRPGFSPLLALFRGAQRSFGVIRRNLLFSLFYNVLGAGLAVAGWLHPLWAAILMPLSSLTVITSSYQAKTFVREEETTSLKSDTRNDGSSHIFAPTSTSSNVLKSYPQGGL